MTAIPHKTDKHYRYGIPNVVTVQIDTREKKPLLFPDMVKIADPEEAFGTLSVAVQTEHVKLEFGDYRLAEYPGCAVVERKAGQAELSKNMCDPRDAVRQSKSFLRLVTGCECPYLLVEATPGHLLAATERTPVPDLYMSRLSVAIAKYRLRLLLLPCRGRDATSRRAAGTFIVHIMLGCALAKAYDALPIQLL